MEDYNHTFHFNPTYEHIHLRANSELRFFCEAFSLMDNMRCLNVLHKFTKRVKETNGAVECQQIIDILKEEGLLEDSSGEVTGFHSLLDSIYQIVNRIILDGFVSSSRTSTLGVLAYQVGEIYKDSSSTKMMKEKAEGWTQLGVRLQDLADYQHKHMRIHHDFQKSNYAPDPRAKTLYGSTFLIIICGFVYLLLRNCKIAEMREFMRVLSK